MVRVSGHNGRESAGGNLGQGARHDTGWNSRYFLRVGRRTVWQSFDTRRERLWARQKTRRPAKWLVNHEEQYAIWPTDRANAPGWRDAGNAGAKSECLVYI